MHELSIALSLVDLANQEAAERGASRVTRVYVRIGALSGVVPDALTFAFDLATQQTLLEGAALEIEDVPLVVFCPRCGAEKQPPERYTFLCPDCSTPTPEIRRGRELQLTAIEIDD